MQVSHKLFPEVIIIQLNDETITKTKQRDVRLPRRPVCDCHQTTLPTPLSGSPTGYWANVLLKYIVRFLLNFKDLAKPIEV